MGSYPRCTVTVYQTGTNTLATIYSNSTGTHLSNPFTAQVNALWNFFAVSGSGYDVVLSGGSPIQFPSPITIPGLTTGISGGGNYFIQSNPTTSQTITQPAGTTLNVNNLNYVANAALYCTTPGTLDGTCLSNAAAASDSVYLAPLAGNSTYTITSSITLSQPNLKVMCAPGVTIATTLTTANVLTFSGMNQSLLGCTLSMAGMTTGNILEVSGATNFLLRDDIITNVSSSYNLRMDAVNGVTIDNLTNPGYIAIFGSPSATTGYVRVVNSNLGSLNFFTGASGSPINYSQIIVSNNHFTVNPSINSLVNVAISLQQTSSNTGLISDFQVNGNVIKITGTTSLAQAFGAMSIVGAPNTYQCSISNNVIDASGQYINNYVMELGVNNCNVEGNTITAVDTLSQGYTDIISYGQANNFTGTTLNGWGNAGGYGIEVYPGTKEPNDDRNIFNGISLTIPGTPTGNGAAIILNCNFSGGSALLNTIGGGSVISGAIHDAIQVVDQTAGGTCNASAQIDGVTIQGAATGIRIAGVTSSTNASIGLVTYSGVTTPTSVLAPAVIATGIYGPLSSTALIPSSLTPSTGYLCYPAAGSTITNVGCASPSAGSVVANPAPLTGQTGSIATTTVYTPATNGVYQLLVNPETSTAGTGSATTVECNASYTNPDGHAWSPTLSASVNLLLAGADSFGGYGHSPAGIFNVEAGTPIQYYCTVTGTATGYTYRVSVSVVYLGN